MSSVQSPLVNWNTYLIMKNMIKTYNLFQLGNGNVGQMVIRKVIDFNKKSRNKISYLGIADSQTYLFSKMGLSEEDLNALLVSSPKSMMMGKYYSGNYEEILTILSKYLGDLVIVDTTATDSVTSFLLKCAKSGARLVLANKKPLVGSFEDFIQLTQAGLSCRSTVGAGLPVIPVIRELISNGEHIQKIEGCFSGSMGVLASELEKGQLFSDIIRKAVEKGLTEPDPRIDLSGQDLANKILILARIAGIEAVASNTVTEKLYPQSLEIVTKEEFLEQLGNLDLEFAQKYQQALEKGNTFRLIATYESQQCKVSFKEVARDSEFGQLKMAEKMAIISTDKQQVIVKGKGSGAHSASQDVLDDIIGSSAYN